MKSHSDFLASIRKRLEKRGISRETSARLTHMLKTLITTLDIEAGGDSELAAQLADALTEDGSLVSLIHQQAAELDALKRITVNLTKSLEPQMVLDEVVKEAMQLVKDARDAHIFLYNRKRMEFGASLMADGTKNAQLAEPRPNGLTHHVARTRELLVVPDIKNHPLYQGIDEDWTGSIIGIPLKMGDRVIGVMNLARSRTGEFTQSEIRLLTMLADQATIAITNSRLHDAVRQQANIDMLTGMPNRRALDKRLEDEIKESARSGRGFCVIMMDLDYFGEVNDTYGHDVGDEVLKQIAQALQENLRASDFLARYGGDELTLVLTGTDLSQAQIVIQKVQHTLTHLELKMPDGQIKFLSISGGIAIHPDHAESAPGLLRTADEALYRAKQSGRGNFQVAKTRNA